MRPRGSTWGHVGGKPCWESRRDDAGVPQSSEYAARSSNPGLTGQANRAARSPGRTLTGRGVVSLQLTRLGPAMDSALPLTLTLTLILTLTLTPTLTLTLTNSAFFNATLEGKHCDTNWFLGNPGALGQRDGGAVFAEARQRAMHQCTHVPMHQCANASMHQCTHVPMHQCTNAPMGQMNAMVGACAGAPRVKP